MFIKIISEYLQGYDMNITVRKNDDDTLTVIIVPKLKSESGSDMAIPPVSCTGTPEYFESDTFAEEFRPVLSITKEKIGGIKIYQDALDKVAKDKKAELEKGKKTTTTAKKPKSSEPTIEKEVEKDVPNPDFIPVDERNEDNPDWTEDYDENTPEFIKETVKEEVSAQKTLI